MTSAEIFSTLNRLSLSKLLASTEAQSGVWTLMLNPSPKNIVTDRLLYSSIERYTVPNDTILKQYGYQKFFHKVFKF